MINLFQPGVGESELSNLKAVFESNWLGRGDEALKFEYQLSKFMGFNEGSLTTVASCSDAIRVITEVLKNSCSIQSPNIILPVNSFPVLASAAVLNGFKIRLCDIDPDSGNICVNSFEKAYDSNTVAAFVTHYGGNRVDIDKLRSRCDKLFVLEDSACALGSICNDGKGVGYNADASVWSFDAMKLVVCGEGGAASFKSEEFLNEFKCRAYLGLPAKAKSGLDAAKDGNNWWEYDILEPSYRSVFTNINAAIGLAQLATIKDRLARKKEIRSFYEANLKVDILEQFNCSDYSNYFFTIRTSARDNLARYLKDNGVYTSLRYWRLDKTKLSQHCEMITKTPYADEFFGKCLNLPIHEHLTDKEVEKVIGLVNKWVKSR
tara:strand:+ start:1689 stop:2819 length:1131 start_codon:yes stop_codon:yes gene_type:complete